MMQLPENWRSWPAKDKREFLALLEAKERAASRNALKRFEPYPKQMEFYAAGAEHRERLLMAANRSGKTYSGAMEMAMHVTGRYPDWWPGRRFSHPIDAWAGSDTTETTRDTVQENLIGPPSDQSAWGTAAIPGDCIKSVARRQGVANSIDTVLVKHVSGGTSSLGFKSYDQGRQKWQGTKKHAVWLDEECPMDIYTEALTRTQTVEDGMIYLTFTPLLGISDVVMMFLGDNAGVQA